MSPFIDNEDGAEDKFKDGDVDSDKLGAKVNTGDGIALDTMSDG